MSTTQDAPPLVERDRRRADFRKESVPVPMADGTEWHFPKPSIYYVRDHTEIGFLSESDLGPSFDSLLNDHRAAMDGGSDSAMIRAQLAIAEFMILVNYDLTLSEVQRLIRFRYERGVDDPTRDGIMRLALGMGGPPGYGDEDGKASPKPGSDGSA